MLTLSIMTDNAAFQEGQRPHELGRLLRKVAGEVENGYEEGHILDINGNKVGAWIIIDKN